MGIHWFCGKNKDCEFEHERDQLVEICNILNDYYDKNKPIYLLYDFKISNRAQIDLLIIQEKGISIIEFKSIKGEIIGSETDELLIKTEEEDLKLDLFPQLMRERFVVIDELEKIRVEKFPNITKRKMRKVQAWGYFEKGSIYDKRQISGKYRVGFDIITCDDLIRKLTFVNAGYKLDETDMIAIKDHFKLGDCPEDDPRLSFLFIEKLEKKWIPKLKIVAEDYHKKIKDEMIEKGEIEEDGKWILNLKARIFEDGKPSDKTTAVKSIDDILKLSNYSVISGFAGSGKSILLHQIYEKIIQKETQYRIPLYISLREIQQYKKNKQLFFNYKNDNLVIPSDKDISDKFLLDITNSVVYSYFEHLTKDEDLIKRKDVYLVLFKKLLKKNYFVFCLDGYDEITISNDLVDEWIDFLFKQNISFLLTTRPIVLNRLQKILGSKGLHYYWLLEPNKKETQEYLENRAKKLGFTILKLDYKKFTPLQLSTRSLFPIELVLDEIQESEFQIYETILWEEFKQNLTVFSRIKSMNDITKLLKSKTRDRLGKKYSVYDLINGPMERKYSKTDFQSDGSILGTCSELAYLSFSGKIDSEYVEKIYKENPYIKLFVDIVTLPELTHSFIYFIKPQLRDYFVNHYIYSLYKFGKMVPLINSDILKMFHKFLENKKPWERNTKLTELGENANDIIVKYLLTKQIKLKPTEHLPQFTDHGDLLIMGRFSLGVPDWYEKLIQGIVNELISKTEPIRYERLSNGLLEIIQRIPEKTLDNAYDPIINDWSFGNTSLSVHPNEYINMIRRMFPEFEGTLKKHIQELFDNLNKLPKNGFCKACEIKKEIDEREKKRRENDYSIEEDDLEEELSYLWNILYTFNLTHEIDGNPTQTYFLNLLESDIDERIKDWAILVSNHDTIYSYQGLLRHRADFTDESYLQYLASRLIEVANTRHLALYAITIWESLYRGEIVDGGGIIPGPEMKYECAYDAIYSLLKRDEVWEDIISYLFSKIIRSEDCNKIGKLLFKDLKESINDKLFRQLTLELFSIVNYYKDEAVSKQISCLKGFEEIWLSVLLKDEEGLCHLSRIDLENYDLPKEDTEKIYKEVKKTIQRKPPENFNPQILIFLNKKGYSFDWKNFIIVAGRDRITDNYFRNLITEISEEELLQMINKLENLEDKLKVAIISRKNQMYLEEFLKKYLVGNKNNNEKSIYQSWLENIFKDNNDYRVFSLVNYAKVWLFEEIKHYEIIIKILSDKDINLRQTTEFFERPVNFYEQELIELYLDDSFWKYNIKEELFRNIIEKMNESLENKFHHSHRYWIGNLLKFLDGFPKLDNLAFEYIKKLIQTKFSDIERNDLLFYYNENPHTNFRELFVKANESINTQNEIENILVIIKYQICNLEREGVFEKKKLKKQLIDDKEFIVNLIEILIDKDIELLNKKEYTNVGYNNFELIDLALKVGSQKLTEYATKVVKCQFTNYQIDKILEIIEKHCESTNLKKELKKIEKILQKEMKEEENKKGKWRLKTLEKSISKCRELLNY